MTEMTRKKKAGYQMADALIEWCHMMYNHKTAQGIIRAVIERLQKRIVEYVPVKQKETKAKSIMDSLKEDLVVFEKTLKEEEQEKKK